MPHSFKMQNYVENVEVSLGMSRNENTSQKFQKHSSPKMGYNIFKCAKREKGWIFGKSMKRLH